MNDINNYRGVCDYDLYENGSLKSCILTEENIINTQYGQLIPQYSISGYGERQKKYRNSLSFYENGNLKSVALDRQLPIKTPLGIFHVELVTFYDDGRLRRIFPLNGKIDGFWSEENEGTLSEPYTLDLPIGQITTKIIGLNFYKSGQIKSVTLWPGESIDLAINNKSFTIRNGISFYEDGSVKSIEPKDKTLVTTPIGEILAFDKDAMGIHGDTNSLVFSPTGSIRELVTTHSGVQISNKLKTKVEWIEPMLIDSIIDDDEKTILPVKITFDDERVVLHDIEQHTFSLKDNDFTIYTPTTSISICSDCSTCSSCK